jgi:RAB protein geranylgeranyltransferase component A
MPWEKLSPLTCASHVVNEFTTEDFVFLNRIWCIENTMMFVIMKTDATETMMYSWKKKAAIEYIWCIIRGVVTEKSIGRIDTNSDRTVTVFEVFHSIHHISTIFLFFSIITIRTIFRPHHIIAVKAIFW